MTKGLPMCWCWWPCFSPTSSTHWMLPPLTSSSKLGFRRWMVRRQKGAVESDWRRIELFRRVVIVWDLEMLLVLFFFFLTFIIIVLPSLAYITFFHVADGCWQVGTLLALLMNCMLFTYLWSGWHEFRLWILILSFSPN